MKGDVTTSSWTVWSVIIFAALIATTILYLQSYYSDYAVIERIPEYKLRGIEAANVIRACFQNGKPYVTDIFLERYDGEDIDDVCGFNQPKADATVTDVENDRKWKFDSNINKPDHSLWIPIAYQNFESVTDKTYRLDKEYIIEVEWLGLGSLKANDIFIEIYPSEIYPGDPSKIKTLFKKYENLEPAKIIEWIESIKDEGVRDIVKVDFSVFPVTVDSILPGGYKLEDCQRIQSLTSKEICFRVIEDTEEINLGRLYVKG